jgi:hypothetical protein
LTEIDRQFKFPCVRVAANQGSSLTSICDTFSRNNQPEQLVHAAHFALQTRDETKFSMGNSQKPVKTTINPASDTFFCHLDFTGDPGEYYL